MELSRKQLLIKILISVLTFTAIILVETKFSGPLDSSKFQASEWAYLRAAIWRWCVRALVWGGGNTPNLVVIIIYSALLE